MPARNTADSYGSVARLFHWLTAALILTAWPMGLIADGMATDTAAAVAAKVRLFSLHKTLGVAILAVALARILWALSQPHPAALHPERRGEAFLAALVHWALYLSLVAVPLSGWVHHAALDGFAPILWPFGQGLPFVPKSPAVAALAGAVHGVATKILLGAIVLHVAGALKHALVDRDGVVPRMLRGTPAAPSARPRRSPAPLLAAVAVYAAGLGLAWAMTAPPEAAPPPVAAAGEWQVQEGSLALTVRQMEAEVGGSFARWQPDIAFDPGTGTGHVRVAIDTASLTLGAVTDQAQGPEFLDTATHPGAVFEADIRPAEGGYLAEGTLSLRGTTRPLSLPFTLALDGETATMQGEVTLDRRDFGIGAAYPDEATFGFAVTVKVALTATRQP